jgi:hypothetical protein
VYVPKKMQQRLHAGAHLTQQINMQKHVTDNQDSDKTTISQQQKSARESRAETWLHSHRPFGAHSPRRRIPLAARASKERAFLRGFAATALLLRRRARPSETNCKTRGRKEIPKY